ncbi:TPA: EamA family transporter, partial [Candidatus Poribacteria bacterium]|nr:EamA family transporter [Candidatus Poribacteria bacterium]
QIGVVMVLSGLGMVVFEGPGYPRGWTVYKGLFITGFFATAVAFWAQNRFQSLISAGDTAIIFASEPVFAAMFGYLFLGERLAAGQGLGALLILTAMLVAQLPPAGRRHGRKDHIT